MSYIDIIFLVIILFFTVWGFRKGLIRSIGGILSIIVAFYVAGLFYLQISIWLQGLSSIFTYTISNILAFMLIFIVVNRLFMLFIYFLDAIFSLALLGFFNKLLGCLLGFFAGCLIVGIIVLIFSSFSVDNIALFQNSKIVPKVNQVINFLKPLIPKSIDTSFLDKDWIISLRNAIDNLPDNILNVDDLITYLKDSAGLPDNIINNIKEKQFNNLNNLGIEEIKSKLEDYLKNK